MSILDANVVDAIEIADSHKTAILVITDHIEWNDPDHELLLRRKVESYLTFVKSGQFVESNKEAALYKIAIIIVAKFSLDVNGERITSKLRDQLVRHHVALYIYHWSGGDFAPLTTLLT